MSSSYIRSLEAYGKYLSLYNFLITQVNKAIRKYYPNMNIDNIDFDKIEADNNVDNLIIEGDYRIFFDQKFLNVSLIFDPEVAKYDDYDVDDFGEFYKTITELSKDTELTIDPFDYGVIMWQVDNLWVISKERFKKLLLYAYYQGGIIRIYHNNKQIEFKN